MEMQFPGNDANYPYRVLNLNKDYTLDQLKTQFKRLVIKYHPDKQSREGPSHLSANFKILKSCYEYLYRQLQQEHGKSTDADPGNGLKRNYEREYDEYASSRNILDMERNFDLANFNEKFENNKFTDQKAAFGYGNLGSIDRQKDKCYIPKPLELADTSEFYELNVEMNDYGRNNVWNNGLHYTDLQMVYTEPQEIGIDNRRQYNSLDELQAERGAPLAMTKEDMQKINAFERAMKRAEHKRLHGISLQEQNLLDYSRRTKNLFIQ